MCLQGREKGTQQTPTSQMATGWDPAAWAGASPLALYGSGISGLLGSPSSSINLNLSDLWTRARALSTILGFDPPQVQQPGLPRNSTMKGNNLLLKGIVPVTTLRNMNVISDIFLKVFIGYLF